MLEPIRCTCGNDLGSHMCIFKYERKKLIKPYNSMTNSDLKLNIVCGPIFDSLGIKNMCCRMHMLTYIVF